ncbi:hypothetical protein CDAR_254651 [Caerostris darwini]|uniref:Uncharacterized protein n=1 Tax=Caerostris darwini TaxID=1538125 RepID=A0AAV4N9Q3_9ARAC|nr:hypothetical protein CDAR_254651 [Caerostris darwini]
MSQFSDTEHFMKVTPTDRNRQTVSLYFPPYDESISPQGLDLDHFGVDEGVFFQFFSRFIYDNVSGRANYIIISGTSRSLETEKKRRN